ncbi:DNA polymerase III subunit alpha [Candidatus Pacearchaeota archaeon]|nr:DNA polymerase III subunit alpha [Candidatus Pacearchaeota archaeon]
MSLRFVSHHLHTSFSLYDAIGTPEDYIKWALKNSGEGFFSVTDHGNMSSIGHIAATEAKYKKIGAPVKILKGIESYFIPSLSEWKILKQKRDLERKEEKKQKKIEENGEVTDLVIEDEKESKNNRFDPINRRNHLILIAYNQIGLTNLFTLVSRSYREGFYRKPRIDLSMLKQFNEGLIASSGCLIGPPGWCSQQIPVDAENRQQKVFELYDREVAPLMEIFGPERFYFELQFNRIPIQQIINLDIIEYSKRNNFKLIATADSHYASPDLFRDRELYRLLGYQMQGKQTDLSILNKNIEDMDAELWLKNGDQMFVHYKDTFFGQFKDEQLIREAIERTYDIAHDFCEDVIPDNTVKLPKSILVVDNKTPFETLKNLVLSALKKRNLSRKTYIERAIYELQIIKKLGVEQYFLTLKEMLDVIRKQQLTGISRGSAGSSLVAYLLNIHFLDPIKYNLIFERFLSSARAGLPDIDSDTEDKDNAFELLKQHFGSDNVLAVTNYNRLNLKSLIKDISKLYGISFEESNACTSIIEKEAQEHIMEEIGYDQKLYEFTFEKAKQYSRTFREYLYKYPKIGEHIENLYKEIRSLGKHAGATLIAPDSEKYIPIIRIRETDQCPVSEGITAQHLKYFGLVKFDILALATLKIIRRCIELILKEKNTEPNIENIWKFYNENLHPDIINTEDKNIFEKVYCSGRFPSVFQFSEKPVQRFCVRAKPKNIDDISTITGLWRPGVLSDKGDKKYLSFNDKEFKKEHSIIQEILEKSRGVLIFQEDFMFLAYKLAGFTLEDSDNLRRLLVKPATSLSEEMKKERINVGNKFIDGCIKNGLTKERADKLWYREIVPFCSYGFCRAHSVGYAFNSYQCSFLYTYYENQWIKACLEFDPNPIETIDSIRRIGYKIEKIDINQSDAKEWKVQNKKCIPAFISLKGIGETAAEEIIQNRLDGFNNLNDFFFDGENNWKLHKINKKTIEILCKVEAFDSFVGKDKLFKNHKHMYHFITVNLNQLKKKKMKLEDAALIKIEDWNIQEKISFQKELRSFYDKGFIVDKYQKTFDEFKIKAIDETEDKQDKKKVWLVIENVMEKTTKRDGRPFVVVKCSGSSEKQYEFKIWNTKKENTFAEGCVIIADLVYDGDYGYSLRNKNNILTL